MVATIAFKELRMLFCTPLAWILLAVLHMILTWVFLGRLDAFLEIQPQLMQLANPPGATEIIVMPVFAVAAIILLIMAPVLTMRMLAEERRNHTLTLLTSAPITLTAIVLGKFFSLLIFFFLVIGLLVALTFSLLAGGLMDFGLLLSNVIGLFFLVASYAALGLYISSLFAQPTIAAVGTLGILLGFWVIDLMVVDYDNWILQLSLLKHFESFNQGLIDTFSVVYFVLFIGVFLILTIRRLDNERMWR